MKSYKFLLLVTLILVVATTMATMRGQSQNNSTSSKQDNQKKLAEDFYTITDYDTPEPSDPQKRTLQRARRKRNNMRFQNNKDTKRFIITEQTESSWGGPPFDVPPEPALPVAQSDAVVVGEVTDAKALLSEDKTSIYSEFAVNISEVLKNTCAAQLAPGSSIDAARYGGAVRFSSGKIIKRGDEGKPFPRIRRRYLFFLKYNIEGQDFSIVTAYELRDGRVFPLDGVDRNGRVFEAYAAYQTYKDLDEATFLNKVREAIATASEGGKAAQ